DLKKLGADFAYTIDGETAGNIEDETFSADGAAIMIEGVSTHPGFAKGKMEHAIKIAAAIVDRLPKDGCSPETTEGKQGFLHPVSINGALEKATLGFIVRDFTDEGLKQKEILLDNIVKDVMEGFPRSSYRLEVKPQQEHSTPRTYTRARTRLARVTDTKPPGHAPAIGSSPPRPTTDLAHKTASDVRDEFLSVTEKVMDELAQSYYVLHQPDINNT